MIGVKNVIGNVTILSDPLPHLSDFVTIIGNFSLQPVASFLDCPQNVVIDDCN